MSRAGQGWPPRRKLLELMLTGAVLCYCYPAALLCKLLLLTTSPNLVFQAEHKFHIPEAVLVFPVGIHSWWEGLTFLASREVGFSLRDTFGILHSI